MYPNIFVSSETRITVLPSVDLILISSSIPSGISTSKWSIIARFPTPTITPSRTPDKPIPGNVLIESILYLSHPYSDDAEFIALAIGWVDSYSKPEDIDRIFSLLPRTTLIPLTLGLPEVMVPVLSITTIEVECDFSNAVIPLINKPCEAPTPVPTTKAVGVARPRAHGQAITSVLTNTMTDISADDMAEPGANSSA